MVFLLLPSLLYDCILQTTRVKNWILLSQKKNLSFSKWFNIALLEIIGIHAFVFIPWALWKSCRPEELKAYSSLNKNLLEIKIKHFWNQEKQKQSLLIQSTLPIWGFNQPQIENIWGEKEILGSSKMQKLNLPCAGTIYIQFTSYRYCCYKQSRDGLRYTGGCVLIICKYYGLFW